MTDTKTLKIITNDSPKLLKAAKIGWCDQGMGHGHWGCTIDQHPISDSIREDRLCWAMMGWFTEKHGEIFIRKAKGKYRVFAGLSGEWVVADTWLAALYAAYLVEP